MIATFTNLYGSADLIRLGAADVGLSPGVCIAALSVITTCIGITRLLRL